ncbi:Uncharacterised protein [uncultured archaeon]|nr:Uncharacterised protein [uncultured archaeon]
MTNNKFSKKRSDNCYLKSGLFFLFLILLIIPNVLSIGITPGRTTINYEKGIQREIEFSVLNNEHKDMKIILMTNEELGGSISLNESIVEFKSDEESKSFKYKFDMPDTLFASPGLHVGDIIALEVPKADSSGTYVGATAAVVSQLFVYVPYPGKYIDADLNVLDSEENGTATFIVPVINRGKVGIGEVRGIIDIYNSLNEKIDSINTDYFTLEPGKRTDLSAKCNINVPTGDYLAKFSVFYDGENRNFQRQFTVGIKGVSVGTILANDFKLGEIAKLQILVENRWNEELKNVFANMIVYDKDYQIMADVRSPNENIPALSEKELVAYWDTVGVREGEYNGKLMVKYGEKSTDKNLILTIKQNKLDVVGVGYAINSNGGNSIDITKILIALIIILMMINIGWFVFFRLAMKRGRHDKKEKK